MPFSYVKAQENNDLNFITTSKELKHTYSGRIDKIIDEKTILLNNGKIIRLVGIDIPTSPPYPDNDTSLKSLMFLKEALPEGTEVMIYQTRMAKKGRVNRMGHDLGHIITKKTKNSPPIWVQGELISNGLARVYTSSSNPELAKEMLELEDTARKNKKGIWQQKDGEDNGLGVLTPDTANNGLGKFSIIEGNVAKVASVKNNLYLNFGENWKTDFTIMISPAMRKKFAHNGVDLMGLPGKKIRVRGFVREYNGPLIELEDPTHLEILKTTLPATDKSVSLP